MQGTNIDRQSYKYTSKTTDEENINLASALNKGTSGQAIAFGFDRTAYASQVNGARATKPFPVTFYFVPYRSVQADGKTLELVKENW